MSWPRNILIVLAVLGLSGCGFHPLYGDSQSQTGQGLRGNVKIEPIGTREGQILHTAIENKFNPQSEDTSNARYRLVATVSKAPIPSVVKSDNTIQRYEIRLVSQFKLYETGKASPVLMGELKQNGSYNVAVNANFASYEAQQDTVARALDEMAEDYVLRIGDYLSAHPDAAPDPAPDPARVIAPSPALFPIKAAP